MACHANCYIDPARWNETCNNWKIQEDCTIGREYLDFISYSPRKHFVITGSCLYFRAERVQLDDRVSTPFCPTGEKYFETYCLIHCDDAKVSELISPGITNTMVSIDSKGVSCNHGYVHNHQGRVANH